MTTKGSKRSNGSSKPRRRRTMPVLLKVSFAAGNGTIDVYMPKEIPLIGRARPDPVFGKFREGQTLDLRKS